MKAIGGYFELELGQKTEYHKNAIKLNSGRAALEYILRLRKYDKVYMPLYTCDTIFEPLDKLGIAHEFYNINEKMEPVFDFSVIKTNEAFLYTNYYGLKDKFIKRLVLQHESIIIDNVPAFFSQPIAGFDCFYSPRKYFGVPDGGYLYLKEPLKERVRLERDYSLNRASHLLKRIDVSPEAGYEDYIVSNEELCYVAPKRMSRLTERILGSIDYEEVICKRRENFMYLHKRLDELNEFDLSDVDFNKSTAIVYPFYYDGTPNLRSNLIKEKIYVAQYWPNVLDWAAPDSIENRLTQKLIALPIDQRYGTADMRRIIKVLNEIIGEKNGQA